MIEIGFGYLKKDSAIENCFEELLSIDKTYPEFMLDYNHYCILDKLCSLFNADLIFINELVFSNRKLEKYNCSVPEILDLQRRLTYIYGAFTNYLTELNKVCGSQGFELITKFLYSNNLDYRIVYETRNIIQHKNAFHIFKLNKELVVSYKELLSGYKLTEKKFNETFKFIDFMSVKDLIKMLQEIEQLMLQYIFALVCDIQRLKRLHDFISPFCIENRDYVIKTTDGKFYNFSSFILKDLRKVINLYDTLPILVKFNTKEQIKPKMK